MIPAIEPGLFFLTFLTENLLLGTSLLVISDKNWVEGLGTRNLFNQSGSLLLAQLFLEDPGSRVAVWPIWPDIVLEKALAGVCVACDLLHDDDVGFELGHSGEQHIGVHAGGAVEDGSASEFQFQQLQAGCILVQKSNAAQQITITLKTTLVGRQAWLIGRGGILEDQGDCLEKTEV